MTTEEALIVVGENVKRLRRKMNMTQTKLASLVDVSQTTISSLERGEKDYTIGLVVRIAAVLEEPLDMLFRSEKTSLGKHAVAQC